MDVAVVSHRVRPQVEGRKRQRSRISNNAALLPGVDGRSSWARRIKDLIGAHIADLGGGDMISEAERSIVRRCATLEAALEQMEIEFARAGAADAETLDLYQRTAGNLRRLLEAIGLERRAKDVPPSPLEYARLRGGAS